MSNLQVLGLLIGLFCLICAMRVPIPFALGLSSVIILLVEDISLRQVAVQIVRGLELFPLLAIPFYVLAGNIMNTGQITDRLIDFAASLVGHIRGGLAQVTVLVSMLMSGMSGSSNADAAGVGAVMIPAMRERGYSVPFAAALVAMSSTMANIIPPSIFMVIYGAVGGVSIGRMFWGGVVPGIMIGLTQMLLSYVFARRAGWPAEPRKTWGERAISFRQAGWGLAIPVIVLGGKAAGIFSPTEAAGALVVYALFVSVVVYRSLKMRDMPRVLVDSAMISVLPLFTVATAALFGWLIGYLQGPEYVAQQIVEVTKDPTMMVVLLILFLFVIGTFLSEIATIIIFMPIIQRIGDLAGMDPVHLGVVAIMVICLGLITPPYGICLMIACGIGRVSNARTFWVCAPFMVAYFVIIALCLAVPGLVLFLPNLLMP